ncbi:hypothetical protein CEXT_590791 [Caerostris extrusa]|uniref:Uncharacterized protein n=1 Tax=Caerostris extrusa TaxID=172846 RepID=A0AAV4VSU8_CAEEX|nr:hypothetical protein CEXT_590791 [Caerostris extrusa]
MLLKADAEQRCPLIRIACRMLLKADAEQRCPLIRIACRMLLKADAEQRCPLIRIDVFTCHSVSIKSVKPADERVKTILDFENRELRSSYAEFWILPTFIDALSQMLLKFKPS